MTRRRAAWRVAWPDALLLTLLTVVAMLAGWLQPRPVSLIVDPTPWLLAAAAVFVYVLASVAVIKARGHLEHSVPPPAAGDSLLVLHASQTGHAEQLAERSAESLRCAGITSRALAVSQLDVDYLAAQTMVLWVLSTTGEGDAPDSASTLVAAMERPGVPSLSGLRYGLLALGDSDYRQFCAFGRRVDAWLRRAGAQPLFDPIEVDNGDAGALRHWQHQLRELAGAPEVPDWEAPRYQRWTLCVRRVQNPGSQGGPVFHLELQPEDSAHLDWEAGDIAEVGPRHADAEVRAWLAQHGYDGAALCASDGESATLHDWVARSHWPDVLPTQPEPQALVTRLQPLPHREYSIASLPADGALHLLVRQTRRDDGGLGLGSGWLTEHAPLDGPIALRVRRNSQFHLPSDDRPLLLIGNGTGIAGLRALLKARLRRGHTRNWLLLGERQSAVDAFYGDELQRWLAAGTLEALDLVWSREGGPKRYVQDRLRDRAAAVREWITDGASIFVCGSREGMAGGVDAALREILGGTVVETLRAEGRYRRDVY